MVGPETRARKALPLDDTLLKRARQFAEALPHSRALGMAVLSAGDGRAAMTMPYRADLVGDPASGVIFGGAVSALMDTCSGLAVFVHPEAAVSMATLDLRIDYMRAAEPGQALRAQAHCFHVTKNVAFVRATAFDADPDRPVATSAGAFALERAGKAFA